MITHRKVNIQSRHHIQSEIDLMKGAIDGCHLGILSNLTFIFCDSKAEACYSIGVKRPETMRTVAAHFEDYFLEKRGGHNGITIEHGDVLFEGEQVLTVDPNWDCPI